MITKDIEKLIELRKSWIENPNYKTEKNIKKIQSKYSWIVLGYQLEQSTNFKEFFEDKLGNRVAITKDNKMLPVFVHTTTPPQFLSFLMAYFILIALGAPLMFMSIIYPEMSRVADSVSIVMNVLGLILNILNITLYRDIMKKQRKLFLLIIGAFVLNGLSLASGIADENIPDFVSNIIEFLGVKLT